MIIDNIILFISIINFLLTLFVFLNAKKSKQHISFLVFSLVTTVWLFDNFLLRIYSSGFYERLSYGLGILVATFALIWVYNLVEEKIPKFVLYFIVPFSILVFFISSFTNYVESPSGVLGSFGSIGAEKGVLFPVYSLYLLLFIVICFYKLGKKSIHEKNILRKKQILSIFIGSVLFGLLAFFVDFFIPLFFNSFEVVDLVTLAYLPLLVFISYSMTKHQLFGIKIMITQFLVIIFLSLLLLNFLFSHSFNDYMWSGTLLLVSIYLSYLIIKNIFRTIRTSDQLLEETKRNLDLEQRLRKTLGSIANEKMRIIESQILNKNKDRPKK